MRSEVSPGFCAACGSSAAPDDRYCRACGEMLTPAGGVTAGAESPTARATVGSGANLYWRRRAAVMSAVLLVAAIAGIGGVVLAGRSDQRHTLTGLDTVSGAYFGSPGRPCVVNQSQSLTPGYLGPIGPGTPVTVFDPSGKVIATGTVGGGVVTNGGAACLFHYQVSVPDSATYQIQIGDWRPFVMSRAELVAKHWNLD